MLLGMRPLILHLDRILKESSRPLSFVLLLPHPVYSRERDALRDMERARPYLRLTEATLRMHKHCFLVGDRHRLAQHGPDLLTRPGSDSTLVWMQNAAGASKWPANPSAVRVLEDAFAFPSAGARHGAIRSRQDDRDDARHSRDDTRRKPGGSVWNRLGGPVSKEANGPKPTVTRVVTLNSRMDTQLDASGRLKPGGRRGDLDDKTCVRWATTGKCHFGDNCWFAVGHTRV